MSINGVTTDLTFSETPAPLVTYYHNNNAPSKNDVTNIVTGRPYPLRGSGERPPDGLS